MSKSAHQLSVEVFMAKAGHVVPQAPTTQITEAIAQLRARLVLEEMLELIEALGFNVAITADGVDVIPTGLPPILGDVAKGCCDVAVVTTGTLSAFGIPDIEIQSAVNQNNQDKFGEGHSYREDGKLVKPPGFKKPDIGAML